jgi:RNA polymerase sigma-70 factor (ECF subfamily)
MTATLSDAQAIARSLEHPESFGLLFERHHPLVHNYLRRRVGDGLADDLAAEAFARAFRGRSGYRPLTDDARPWLLGIATKLAAGHRRAEARALRAWQRCAASPAPSSDGPERLDRELGGALASGLQRLSRRDREALLLLAWGELTYAEIGCALDVPVGTVRSRIHHARRQLTRQLPETLSILGEARA